MGVRPLYYCAEPGCVRWSTSLGELVTRAGRRDAIDERFITGFMTLTWSTDVTPYVGVRAVPTAKCVSITSDGAEKRSRFWKLEPATIRYSRTEDYAEHLRALWRAAVGARLDVEGTVWAELSGGLDSSSVVCMADALIKEGAVAASGIAPLSHVATQSPESDERRFIGDVEAQVGVQSQILSVEEHQDLVDEELGWVTPYASRGVSLAGTRFIARCGGGVVLSGRVGDLVMGCISDNSVAILDDISDRHWASAFRGVHAWSRATRKPFIEIASNLVRHQFGFQRSSAPAAGDEVFRLLTPRLKSMTFERDSSDTMAAVVAPAKREFAISILGYSVEARLNIPVVPPDVTYAHPFLDRRLVEFVLAIPIGRLSTPGEMRALMRLAFAGLLPPRVVRRVSKGHYAPALLRAAHVRATSAGSVERLEVVRRGWFDSARLNAAIEEFVNGNKRIGAEVGQILLLEDWLAMRNRRGHADIPQRKEVRSHEVLNT